MMVQIMRRFDRNQNGRLEPDEQKALTMAFDKNLDGRVSPDEVMAALRGGGEGERAKEGVRKKKEE